MIRKIENLLNWIYPPKCILCGELLPLQKPERDLCINCIADFPWMKPPVCKRCGKSIESNQAYCISCQKKISYFDRGFCVFHYGVVKRAIAELKYQGYKQNADILGCIMAEYMKRFFTEYIDKIDFMIPVPMFAKKQKARGFNQAELLAKAIHQQIDIPILQNICIRIRNTIPQNGLSPAQRIENLKEAFALTQPEAVNRKRILLIDDIFTTGTTINQCAITLKRAGADTVYFLALASAGDSYDI